MSSLTVIGAHPFAIDEQGRLKSRIATVFISTATLVTLPGIHATQRMAYTSWLNERRRDRGEPLLTPEEECEAWQDAVDLIIDGLYIQIRPDPENMAQAFEADRLLQQLPDLSKRRIRFLHVRRKRVQQAIRERGEYWRIAPLPQLPTEIIQMIDCSRIEIDGEPIYYYSMEKGTRLLTLQQFSALADMDDERLRRHMREIVENAAKSNSMGQRELDFFGADRSLHDVLPSDCDWERASCAEIRARHQAFAACFRRAVPLALQVDAPDNLTWRNQMFSCLTEQSDDTVSDDVVQGISPEFFMQIRWLPGGRIENGELLFDSIFAETENALGDDGLRDLCDMNVKGIIFNYVREFGDLEYINVGQVAPGLRIRPRSGGHRAYIAEIKHRGSPELVVRIIRIQKWGIREHLDEGKHLLRALVEAEDYTEYILDRRLGCWQLGMPLPGRIMTGRIAGVYRGKADKYRDTRIWTTYFERDYLAGVATDKIAAIQYRDQRFCAALARLLGRAAATNLVVGRTTLDGKVIFDDGDEILLMDRNGLPNQLIAADHAGTFTDCESPLVSFGEGYARPVLARRYAVTDADAFATAYLHAFEDQLTQIQDKYRKRRRAFDTLFKHGKQDVGSFAWRWRQVLKRLDQTEPAGFIETVRAACEKGLGSGAPARRLASRD